MFGEIKSCKNFCPNFSAMTSSNLEYWAKGGENVYCVTYVAGLSLEDNGNYTCEISGPHNALLGFVTHRIFVRGIRLKAYVCTNTMRVKRISVVESYVLQEKNDSGLDFRWQFPGLYLSDFHWGGSEFPLAMTSGAGSISKVRGTNSGAQRRKIFFTVPPPDSHGRK